MATASQILTGLVALLHVYFLVLEMFLWTGPVGQRTFKRTAQQQLDTRSLAQNQGLYNGFLAAGPVWSYFARTGAYDIRVFFLGFGVVAGVYGAGTAAAQIPVVQALAAPAGAGGPWPAAAAGG